ncbi:hypothetical protein ACN38_g426 [Penicillium nordicum]|uniref:Uncharacterized protein n=1 Tax=Penicillium nordicum TaxID=229535 RepID=A0A0M8PHA8_9EURO|nr:hypothetical protein ACN38_g426 [Penicillium nordicum]
MDNIHGIMIDEYRRRLLLPNSRVAIAGSSARAISKGWVYRQWCSVLFKRTDTKKLSLWSIYLAERKKKVNAYCYAKCIGPILGIFAEQPQAIELSRMDINWIVRPARKRSDNCARHLSTQQAKSLDRGEPLAAVWRCTSKPLAKGDIPQSVFHNFHSCQAVPLKQRSVQMWR